MIASGMVSAEAMALLWLAVDARIPVIVYGPMRTGKTSLTNAVLMLVPPDASIAVVQDAPEMRVYHSNFLSLYTSERVGFEELAKLALRKSVDYLFVNEIRVREEARWWSQLTGTGHGGVTTIHASTLEAVFGRLRDFGVERALAESVKFAVRTSLFWARVEGRRVRVSRVLDVSFVESLSEDFAPSYVHCFAYDPAGDSLRPGSGLEAALSELARHIEDPEGEMERRAEFLRLAVGCGYLEAKRFWDLHVSFRRDPDAVLERLRAEARPAPRPRAVPLPLDEVRFCPLCGSRLTPTRSCPRCGWSPEVVARAAP